MATCCNPKGVTIVEVDGNGKILNSTPGYGQGWRFTPPKKTCGSPEWLSELVLTPDNGSLQTVVGQAKTAGQFKGEMSCGTSCTTCQGAVYRLPAGAPAPNPTASDYKYYVMAQGVWIDKKTGLPLRNLPKDINDDSEYLTSAFIISEYPIDKIDSLKVQWNELQKQALAYFLALQNQ